MNARIPDPGREGFEGIDSVDVERRSWAEAEGDRVDRTPDREFPRDVRREGVNRLCKEGSELRRALGTRKPLKTHRKLLETREPKKRRERHLRVKTKPRETQKSERIEVRSVCWVHGWPDGERKGSERTHMNEKDGVKERERRTVYRISRIVSASPPPTRYPYPRCELELRIILLLAIPREDQRTRVAGVDVTPSIPVQTTIMQKPVMNKEGNSLKLKSKPKRGGSRRSTEKARAINGDGDGNGDEEGDGEHGPSARVAAGRAGGWQEERGGVDRESGRIRRRSRKGPTNAHSTGLLDRRLRMKFAFGPSYDPSPFEAVVKM
ncbi:hypothetical protein B0H11DRAFT_1942011 [Mycena galericulata]|nr:hypothetical protein B0H11DRAFT_1942011 [Mycena galericulata]